jgi:PhnB protein
MVDPVPEGYPVVTPYLSVRGAADAIGFYTDIFGATERMRMPGPDGRIGHAELQIRDSVVMLSDEFPDMGVLSPQSLGGTPVTLSIYVDDVDSVIDRAVAAGATLDRPIEDRFYGDRSGQIVDPWGHRWSIATHVEDVPPDEMQRRAAEFMESETA